MSAAQDPDELLERIRVLEDAGEVKEATALARAAVADGVGGYDWNAELMRLDAEGKLARPYREGVEALHEGDYADAQRLLGWVVGKNPRYREVSRYLYWAVEGRDPAEGREGAASSGAPIEDDAPPSGLGGRRAARSPLASALTWALVFVAAGLGFLAGFVIAPAPEVSPGREAATTPTVAPAAPSPATASTAAAPPAPPPSAAPSAPPAPTTAPVAPAPTSAAAPAPTSSAPASPASPAPTSAAAKSAAASNGSTAKTTPPSAADRANAAALGCQDGVAKSCFELGDAYYYGRGASKSKSQALSAYSRSCDHGYARGCFNAGDMVENGEVSAADAKRALELYARGCTLGDSDACTRKVLLEVTSK